MVELLAGGRSASPPAHILIVDDERALRRTLADIFLRLGYRTTEAETGEEALGLIARQPFDLVLLDLKMPGMDGIDVLKAARPMAPDTVFIILTAYATLDSAIAAIRYGAFDYLLKPSPMGEIIRAVEAGLAERRRRLEEDPEVLLERALASLRQLAQRPAVPPAGERFLQAPGITVDASRRLVVVEGHPVDLTPTEFEILIYLMRHRDRVVSARELAAHLRGCELEEQEARTLLRSHISRLRRKLERAAGHARWIQTMRGSGYLFDAGGQADS